MRNSDRIGQPQFAQGANYSGYQIPTEIVELPSKGKLYPEDHPLRDEEKVEIKFMTTKEEDLMVSPSLSMNGLAIDRVIESLVVSKRIDASTLIPGDKNAILIAARKSAYGSDYKFKIPCASCMTFNDIKVSIDDITIKEITENEEQYYSENGNIMVKLPKSQALVEIKIITNEDEKIIEETTKRRLKNNLPGEELLTRYRRMIVSVNGSSELQVLSDFIVSLGIADSRVLKKKYLDMVPDVSFTYSHNCTNCGHAMEGGVPIGTDFFWPQL